MNRQDFNQMMKDSFGDKVVNIPSKTDNELIAEFMGHDTYESNGYIMVRYSDTVSYTHLTLPTTPYV